ncbi:MAG TPA: hypothetical protein VJR89_25835, partial [Polyangiales bacterium]|nr:hypothetical protein [Polyangiales bacterium]
MRITQSLGRVGLSIVFAGAMFAACDDDDDNIDTDTNAQRADAGEARDAGPTESGARAGRGGSGGNAARAGTGGSGGAVASAGRGGAG